jgi:hypothetical protein
MIGINKVYWALCIGFCLTFVGCKKEKVGGDAPANCKDTISFNQEILPMIQNHCSGCHGNGNSTGYTLVDHGSISSNASAVIGSMKGNGYQLMPQGGPALPDSLIQKVECWIYQGKKNN